MKDVIKFTTFFGEGGNLINPNPVFKLRIVVLLVAVIIGMIENAKGSSLQSIGDNVDTQLGVSTWMRVAEADADRDSEVLVAMANESSEDQEELEALMAILEEETEIATKTKMNNDYVPGMVTVLHGDHLEALGIQTVAEALAMVPGIQLSRIASGEPTVKVRGMSYPFNAGNIKVMLNSIGLSRESSGLNSSVLLMPVAQVERIEIVRGPGSSVYGDFAMTGVVNIITHNTDGRLFGHGGDDESWSGGGHYAYRDEKNSFGLGLNLSVVNGGENATIINRNPEEERMTGIFTFDYKQFTFTLEGSKRSVDYDNVKALISSTGPLPPDGPPVLPLSEPDRFSQNEKSWAMEGRQSFDLGRVSVEAYLSYLKNNGRLMQPNREFLGDRVETGLDLTWSPWSSHQFLFSFSYTDSNIDSAYEETSSETLELIGLGRRNFSLGIQDIIEFNDNFALTLGVRFDDYDDVGNLLTPRIAGVYRLGDHHVLKAQYSEGFRAPTFWELYRTGTVDERLDFEVIGTTEIAYIYRRPKAVGRVTLYYSEIDKGLFAPGNIFENIAEIGSKGVEMEWDQQINEKFRWLANVSYVDTWDNRWIDQATTIPSPGVSQWLGNMAFFLQPVPKLMLTGRLLYVGDMHALDGWVKGYETVDVTLSRKDLWKKGITLRGGVKNVFDNTVIYTTMRPHGLSEDEFCGCTWWLQLSYDF